MTTIGSLIDHARAKSHLDEYFTRMKSMANNEKLAIRMRFMLQEVIDLRRGGWKQRVADPAVKMQQQQQAQMGKGGKGKGGGPPSRGAPPSARGAGPPPAAFNNIAKKTRRVKCAFLGPFHTGRPPNTPVRSPLTSCQWTPP